MALPVRVARGRTADPVAIARNDFNTMISRLFGGAMLADDGDGNSFLSPFGNFSVDVREDADHIYVEADLPGFRKEDIDISLENGTLTIIAEHKEEITEPLEQGQQAGQATSGQQQQQPQQPQQRQQPQQQGEYLLRERRYQRFIRSFTLPPNVDDQNVEAKLENGVLTITLNKREDAKPKRVKVS